MKTTVLESGSTLTQTGETITGSETLLGGADDDDSAGFTASETLLGGTDDTNVVSFYDSNKLYRRDGVTYVGNPANNVKAEGIIDGSTYSDGQVVVDTAGIGTIAVGGTDTLTGGTDTLTGGTDTLTGGTDTLTGGTDTTRLLAGLTRSLTGGTDTLTGGTDTTLTGGASLNDLSSIQTKVIVGDSLSGVSVADSLGQDFNFKPAEALDIRGSGCNSCVVWRKPNRHSRHEKS